MIRFFHGTTVATNAVLTRRGARIGLLATAGFEDVLEIGRQKRSHMYDLFQPPETPVFLVPKRRRFGIAERIAPDGGVTAPLDEAGVRTAIVWLLEEHRIEALALCYLFSFRNPRHERRTREIAVEVAPGLPVSLSCGEKVAPVEEIARVLAIKARHRLAGVEVRAGNHLHFGKAERHLDQRGNLVQFRREYGAADDGIDSAELMSQSKP